jgi:eukaryotic-like serine/threonine-protein kinase
MTRTVSHYRLEDEIGRGGMGIVYRAVDTRLGRTVAIKMVLAPDGQRFVMIKEGAADDAASRAQIIYVQNFFEELRRLVPTN